MVRTIRTHLLMRTRLRPREPHTLLNFITQTFLYKTTWKSVPGHGTRVCDRKENSISRRILSVYFFLGYISVILGYLGSQRIKGPALQPQKSSSSYQHNLAYPNNNV